MDYTITKQLPIGVFDSGVGGLTVAKEIMKQLPNENIIYFGDTARVPYGNKSRETVTEYSRQIVTFLLSKKVKAIVIACNTASAFALETIAKEFPEIPMIGVVLPGAKAAAEASKNGRIGVIGTAGTVRSGLYGRYLVGIRPDCKVYGQACPLFVPLVEEGWADDPITEQVVHRYLDPLLEKDVDSIVLGCTHYPLLKDVIEKVAGPSVTLVNPAYETAKELSQMLFEADLLADEKPKKGHYTYSAHTFFVSDGAEQFRAFANSILPCEMIETKDVNVKVF